MDTPDGCVMGCYLSGYNAWKKEGGQYYYYVKGKKVKNTWKTVTVANKTTGKKMTYRYYFSNTGKAYKGGTFFGENYLLVKKDRREILWI